MSLASETPGKSTNPVESITGGTMGGIRAGSRERAFANRFEQALDNHPRCPDAYGRLTWVQRELAHQRVNVTLETIRRWLSGMTMPRRAKMTALAKMLGVDETWLAMGVQPVSPAKIHKAEELEEALREIEEITDDPKIREIIARTRK